MEDRLKGLRKSMENTTFKHLSFSDQNQKQVREKINQSSEKRRHPFSSVATSYE